MLVSAGRLTYHGQQLGLGDPIPEPEKWRGGMLALYLRNGSILDVSPEDAERLRAEQVAKEVRSLGQRAKRLMDRAAMRTHELTERKNRLTTELADVEEALDEAEIGELQAADDLEKLRAEHGDVMLGFVAAAISRPDEPAPAPVADVEEAAVASEAKDEDEDDGRPKILSDEELQAKAVAALGGYKKSDLLEKVLDWYGVDLATSLPKEALKADYQKAAYQLFKGDYYEKSREAEPDDGV